MTTQQRQKPIHSIVLDTGPLIKNSVSISTIVASAEVLYTTPAIISEIRDAATRSRVETTLKPFLNIRTPSPASYEAVSAFAKKTGDFAVLSRQDLGILALAYEVHCEKHGGPWGLRNTPKGPLIQKPGEKADEKEDVNLKGDKQPEGAEAKTTSKQSQGQSGPVSEENQTQEVQPEDGISAETSPTAEESKEKEIEPTENHAEKEINTTVPLVEETPTTEQPITRQENAQDTPLAHQTDTIDQPLEKQIDTQGQPSEQQVPSEPKIDAGVLAPETVSIEKDILNLQLSDPGLAVQEVSTSTSEEDSDANGWITPKNIAKKRAKDAAGTSLANLTTQMAVTTMTIDFAMQNVLLQMNLNLLSTNMQRIHKLRSTIMRCHACFFTTKEMDKQFCPRCGQATLSRVTCSTNAKGEFRVHLSKNYQYNKRGDRYSIPKPVGGSSNGKFVGKGGGKGGWGRELVLAEDQKEYVKQKQEGKRREARSLMDEDYLPSILTGDRGKSGGRPKVGAGRNINSRKRF